MTFRPMLDAIAHVRSMPDEQAAQVLTRSLGELDDQAKRSFCERGLILLESEKRLLWQYVDDPATGVPFTSFERWVMGCAPWSRSDCFAAKGAVKELLRDIPAEKLLEIPRMNINILLGVSSQVRKQPEVIKAASECQEKQFVERIQRDFPDQHIEERRTLHLKPSKGASEMIEKAIRIAMDVEGCTGRSEAMEAIAVAYIQSHEA